MEMITLDKNWIQPGDSLPLSALRLLVSPLRLVSAAIWQTVQEKVVADYGMLEEFVCMITDIVPQLLSDQQRLLLRLGLRARLILELCRLDAPEPETIQPHLDRLQMLTKTWLSEISGANIKALDSDFVDLVNKLLANPDEKRLFFQKNFHEDFGATFDKELHSLMLLFLSRLEKFFPTPTFQEVASMFGETSNVLVDCMQTVSQWNELQTLLCYQKTVHHLARNDTVLNGGSILSALRLLPLEAAETETREDIANDVDESSITEESDGQEEPDTEEANSKQELVSDTERPEGTVESPCEVAASLKECRVQLTRITTTTASSCRSTRPNRGLKMKMFLLEEKRDLCEDNKSASRKSKTRSRSPGPLRKEEIRRESVHVTPTGLCSDADSWSYYSDDSCQRCSSPSEADSWSYYSSDGSSVTSPDGHSDESNQNELNATSSSTSQKQGLKKTSAVKKTHNLPCFICNDRVYTSLTAHMKTHFPDGNYTCPRCGASYKVLVSLLHHFKKACFQLGQQYIDPEKQSETKDLYQCDKCQQAFRYKISLQRHTLTHHELYCSVCQKIVRDAATLARHKTSHTPFQCTRCSESFLVFKHLLTHCKNVHKIREPFQCTYCPKISPRLRFLIRHEWRHTGLLPLQCAMCSLRFKSDADLVVHQRVHTREKPHLCTECGKTFSQGSNLCRHLKLVHGGTRNIKRESCLQCEKSFKDKGALKKHQRTKHLHEFLRYPCPCCGKMISASTMARHKLMHTGEKPFKCSESDCDKCFRSKSEVKRHFLTHHSTERPFKCATCGKGFIGKSHLQAHVKIHSGDKPFACNICDKRFPKAYSMLRHKTLIHAFVKH